MEYEQLLTNEELITIFDDTTRLYVGEPQKVPKLGAQLSLV